jgi:D-arginine dehydrogenase
MLIDSLETFYVKPDAGRFILSPADETDVEPHDAAADDYALAEGAERMSRFIDWDIRRKPSTWAGLRTFSQDRVPVLGHDPGCPGFFWLVGQGGFGVQSAPGAAALAAHMIDPDAHDLPPGIEPSTYAPARFRA